ncbi:hypothetical protein [Candidatus Poriferisodalis sp.]|uniref:hypothetical protein n=1 Tax=Candidatus Poriferisodalis sp. TaxID=3101277 RepID=UPI003B01835D
MLSPWEPLLPEATPQLGTPPAHAQELDDDGGGGDQNPPPDNNGPENGPPGGEVGPPAQNNDGETPEETPTQAPGDECAQPQSPDGEGSDGGGTAAGVVCGTPADCPSVPDGTPEVWTPDPDDPSRCVWTMPACPRSPLQEPGQPVHYTVPSEEFPELCEHVVPQSNHSLYPLCTARYAVQSTTFAYKVETRNHEGGSVQVCRAIVPGKCPSGMHRLAPGSGRDTSDSDGVQGADENQLLGNNPIEEANADRPLCRQYQRRHWSCSPPLRPLNQFNACYRDGQERDSGGHPACSTAAPQFAISDCETYVGTDYMPDPASFPCRGYDTRGNARELTDISNNDHWCSYSRSWLDLRCHGASPAADCPSGQAVCIKRASNSGGCSAVAKTIRCHVLQARQGEASQRNDGGAADAVQQAVAAFQREGCRPCTILPFEPVQPSDAGSTQGSNVCPPELSRPPIDSIALATDDRCKSYRETKNPRIEDHPGCQQALDDEEKIRGPLDVAMRRGMSIDNVTLNAEPECSNHRDKNVPLDQLPRCLAALDKQDPFCGEPDIGALESTAASGSGALVNSPVVVTFAGAPIEAVSYKYFTFWGATKDGRFSGLELFDGIEAMVYSNTPQLLVGKLPDLLKAPRSNSEWVYKTIGESGGGCFLEKTPITQLTVSELLPDIDYQEIVRLFGKRAVQQWDSWDKRPDIREAYIRARGFNYITETATDDEIRSERELRAQAGQRQEVACNQADDSQQWWCRWVPQRAGFFKLTGQLAWQLRRWTINHNQEVRKWISIPQRDAANQWLTDNVADPPDDVCDQDASQEQRVRDVDCIREDLRKLGVDTLEDAGFTLNDENRLQLLDWPTEPAEAREALYRGRKPYIHLCPSQDVRVICQTANANLYFAYSETDSIGIAVQEARVVTRTAPAP